MITIRSVLKEELDLVRSQRLSAYEEHAMKLPSDHWEGLKAAIRSDADVEDGAELLVAESDGEIVGSVVLCPENTDAYKGLTDRSEYPEIRMLAVDPAARKKGVALALINACIDRSKEAGKKAIGLHTGDFMDRAMALYERRGFVRIPEFDFEPVNDGIIVKAFRYPISENQ